MIDIGDEMSVFIYENVHAIYNLDTLDFITVYVWNETTDEVLEPCFRRVNDEVYRQIEADFN